MSLATKSIQVTPQTFQKIKALGLEGQSFDELINEMVEAYKREQFLKMLEERRESGDFKDFDEVT